ncbi:Cytochrome C-type biogenesis protein (plasmid) [Cupriavidus necator H16]|uniref:C-type cytochrome biogenesis protein CcmI n=1 Tax=Cupriavidus necator (strain ATCC 17699 / DSM 428 / KCTC 22496 / NCIMB 10442 / H16 / Stanier 337) TaxID=381666 RepID=Q7WXB4_CUPNH|nr:c-type cytochrome biogenesis protein CcmI [Cupriavidus necator]AAP85973.1 cytochrome C-type biogenesis protein [Cupriavidus necator H16]QCC05467.1 c-type cytochrome biogenesis protein CcmI [Cupriavidus necator H16]QQB81288.1 c-type cytochrome biogenesis protein CcmI [Cupriavidus necator]
MTTFWLLAAALIAATMACLLWPLLRHRVAPDPDTPERALLADLYREQLNELDTDLQSGTLTAARHAGARDELARRLLDENASATAAARQAKPSPLLAAALLAVLPSAAILLYLHLGNPVAQWSANDMPAATDGQHQLSGLQLEGMVNQLAKRLRDAPGDAEGWAMLARSYSVMERHDDAAAAYAKAIALAPDVAPLRSDYADVLASLNGGSLEGAPMEQIGRALALDPDDPKGLALAASAAAERGDTQGAIGYWEHLYRLLPADSQTAARIAANLAAARGTAATSLTASGEIGGIVTLGEMAGRIPRPDETVFIYARAVDGPRMPLAVIRRTVRDLPARFTLDDSMALGPDHKLTGYPRLMVEARISASGNATPQAGDLVGRTGPVAAGSHEVQIVIDSIVPDAGTAPAADRIPH